MIPKILIQTARNLDLPPLARASATNLQLLHPDWEYRFFDDEAVSDFVATEFPEFKALFDGFPYKIQRFDFFRYLAVYKFGGFYFDLDVLLSLPLDVLLDNGSVFPFEELTLSRYLRTVHGMDWDLGNYAFGAAAGDPFLGRVIENCVRSQNDPEWTVPMMRGIPRLFRPDFEVLNSTGPGMLSRTLAESQDIVEDIHVLFPYNVFDENHWHQFGTYGIHLMEGSWRDRGNFFRRKFIWKWEAWERKRGLAESRQRGVKRAAYLRASPAR